MRFLIKYRNSGNEKSGLRIPYRINYLDLHNCENDTCSLYGQNDNIKRLLHFIKNYSVRFLRLMDASTQQSNLIRV